MDLYGAPKDRGYGFPGSQQESWTVAVRMGTHVRKAIPSRQGMRLFRCWEPALASDAMGISSCQDRQCAALLPAAPEVTEPGHGVPHRDPGILAALWFAAGGLRAGIGSGKGIVAHEGVGFRP